jgi:hypothetical protein
MSLGRGFEHSEVKKNASEGGHIPLKTIKKNNLVLLILSAPIVMHRLLA